MRPSLILAGCLAAAASGLSVWLAAAPGTASAPAPRVVPVVARRFSFAPEEIVLKRGEAVILELTTTDRSHGFKLPAWGIRVDVLPGETVRVPVTPLERGTFAFVCDVFCGDDHDDMTGIVKVE